MTTATKFGHCCCGHATVDEIQRRPRQAALRVFSKRRRMSGWSAGDLGNRRNPTSPPRTEGAQHFSLLSITDPGRADLPSTSRFAALGTLSWGRINLSPAPRCLSLPYDPFAPGVPFWADVSADSERFRSVHRIRRPVCGRLTHRVRRKL